MKRSTHITTNGLEISHSFGERNGEGDIDFEAERWPATSDELTISFHKTTGRDRDGYGQSHTGELKLNDEECRDLLLLLTAHLERKAEAR